MGVCGWWRNGHFLMILANDDSAAFHIISYCSDSMVQLRFLWHRITFNRNEGGLIRRKSKVVVGSGFGSFGVSSVSIDTHCRWHNQSL